MRHEYVMWNKFGKKELDKYACLSELLRQLQNAGLQQGVPLLMYRSTDSAARMSRSLPSQTSHLGTNTFIHIISQTLTPPGRRATSLPNTTS